MIGRIALGGVLVAVGLAGSGGHNNAFACNRTAGCAMDVLHEDYDMKQDGRMDEAIEAGRENVEAFRALQAAPQKRAARPNSSARK